MKKITIISTLLLSFMICSSAFAQFYSCRAKMSVTIPGERSREYSTVYAIRNVSGQDTVAGCLSTNDLSLARNALSEMAFNELCVRSRKYVSYNVDSAAFVELVFLNSSGWGTRVEWKTVSTGPVYCDQR